MDLSKKRICTPGQIKPNTIEYILVIIAKSTRQ